ncbi:signal peptidase I [Xenococcus sp. PCC 7305]|uniref:signal peptidase I n=1 Tax=Xenococcus sp. PCC 7305 TaxID=102125 RepID=UPI0002ACC280|nr:signal peptidase I [Xenococcus sp. PCC 7305]ELS01362.1 signal peptidase I [Xenococcus sp. PCC 7305]
MREKEEQVVVQKSPEQQEENIVVEIVKTLVTAAILAFGIRTFVAEARYIPSESMQPTLEINDRLIIEKISYRFRTPQRGDVVVFRPTEELKKQGYKEAFIKRVIGLPGDTVEVKNDRVFVNGQELAEKYIYVPNNDPGYQPRPQKPYGPTKVPEDQYLVLGDNRNNSLDSRSWGFVPQKNLIGRATVRFWPLQRLGTLDEKPLYPN